MSDLAIKVENLSKLYRIGTKQERYNPPLRARQRGMRLFQAFIPFMGGIGKATP